MTQSLLDTQSLFDELADAPIDLPQRPDDANSRRFTFRANDRTQFTFVDGDTEYEGYIRLGKIRQTRFQARHQGDNSGKVHLMVVSEFTFSNDEIGLVTDGKDVPLAPYTSPAFAQWRARPHRLHTQTWSSDPEVVLEHGNRLLKAGYIQPRLNRRPRTETVNDENGVSYDRQTRDLFNMQPRPPAGQGGVNWDDYGESIAEVTLSLNPGYEKGFKNFVHGTMTNVLRLVQAAKEDEKARAEGREATAVSRAAVYSDSLGGVVPAQGQNRAGVWPRRADLAEFVLTDKDKTVVSVWNPNSGLLTLDQLMPVQDNEGDEGTDETEDEF